MTGFARRPLIGIPCGRLRGRPEPGWPARVDCVTDQDTHALVAAGGAPIAIPLDLPEDALHSIFGLLNGLCLTGGVDIDPVHYGESRHPALGRVDAPRDANELLIARWALAAGMPILGICRGIQLLNVAAHGSLYQDIAAQLPSAQRHSYSPDESPWDRASHCVRFTPDSQLARILGTVEVWTNSFHHQAVKEPAPGFAVSGRAEDGVVEGIEARSHPFAFGVQWHAECMYETHAASQRLFISFVSAARGEA
jgi:putative glutamine amidotransferase